MELTRRHALAGAAGIAAAPLLSTASADAATAPAAEQQAPSFYRYKVGDIMVTVVSDGKYVFKLEDSFITNAKKEEVSAALAKAFLPSEMFTIYFAPLVLNIGNKVVVIDTGNGALAKANSKGSNGLFADNMVAAGFDPKAVHAGIPER
jgi:hypothetical protein